MLILTFRTDKPESELGLYEDNEQLAYLKWEAHRALAETIHLKIQELMALAKKDLKGVSGIAAYKGPGSFTGLRIGLSVANALAYSLSIPIVGVEGEENWLEQAIEALLANKSDTVVLPEYGAPVHITTPKK